MINFLIPWIILFLFIFGLWLLNGNKEKEFLGLKPLYSKKYQQLAYDPFSPNYVEKYYNQKSNFSQHDDNPTTTAGFNSESKPINYPQHLPTLQDIKSEVTKIQTENHIEEQLSASQNSVIQSYQISAQISAPLKASLSAFENDSKDHYIIEAKGTDMNTLRNNSEIISKWKSENDCCLILQDIYGKPFKSARPSWLKNPETNGILELDCYNEDLKIAVEYNGVQHYKFPNPFHKTYEEFIAQVRRDEYKVNRCDQQGVYLISVPYTVPKDKLRDYITHYLPENRKYKSKCKFESIVCMA